MSDRWKKIIDIVQWVLIAGLVALCIFIYIKGGSYKGNGVSEDKDSTYIKIYESQTIESLKKENEELYDSIKDLKNVESAIVVKYKYKYKSDTIRTTDTRYLTLVDSVYMNIPDSTYHYAHSSDTVNYELDINAKGLSWHFLKFSISDKFTIINKNDGNNNNILTIDHSKNADIEVPTAFRKKESTFKKNFSFGPVIGAGFDPINKFKPSFFIGVSFGYDLLK